MAKKLILSGRVQGVFCRKYCSTYAKKMRLSGSATNLPDGTVRVILDTDDETLVKEYIYRIKSNPDRVMFFGSIEEVTVADFNGASSGDYTF